MLENIKKMSYLSSGIVYSETNEAPHELTQLLSKITFKAINKIKYHDILCAALFLHPGLSSFHFMSRVVSSECRKIVEVLLQRMLSGTVAPSFQLKFTFPQSSQV